MKILIGLLFLLFIGCGSEVAIIEAPAEVYFVAGDTTLHCYVTEESVDCEEVELNK